MVAAVTGTAADVELLDGQIQISVAESPELKATATGRAGSASVTWNAPLVKVDRAAPTSTPSPSTAAPSTSWSPSNPLLSLEAAARRSSRTWSSRLTAPGPRRTASVLNVEVGLLGITIADLDLFPFAVERAGAGSAA